MEEKGTEKALTWEMKVTKAIVAQDFHFFIPKVPVWEPQQTPFLPVVSLRFRLLIESFGKRCRCGFNPILSCREMSVRATS